MFLSQLGFSLPSDSAWQRGDTMHFCFLFCAQLRVAPTHQCCRSCPFVCLHTRMSKTRLAWHSQAYIRSIRIAALYFTSLRVSLFPWFVHFPPLFSVIPLSSTFCMHFMHFILPFNGEYNIKTWTNITPTQHYNVTWYTCRKKSLIISNLMSLSISLMVVGEIGIGERIEHERWIDIW